jgi:hypothetical protein
VTSAFFYSYRVPFGLQAFLFARLDRISMAAALKYHFWKESAVEILILTTLNIF